MSVSQLLETLQLSHPSIAAEAAAEFRTALVAILQQLEQDETAANRSLQGWWTWLDEEGYDRDGFGLILNQVGEAKLGQQGQAELLSLLQANAAEPGGVPRLIDHVQSEHPALAKEIESLETLALTEEQQLHATAGGSKAGKDVAIGVGVVAGTAATVFIGYKATKGVQWLANKWNNRNQGAGEMIENGLQREEAREMEQLDHRAGDFVREERDRVFSFADRAMHVQDPQRLAEDARTIERGVRDNTISITEYTETHIKARVSMLVEGHIDEYGEKELGKTIDDMIRLTPGYSERVIKIAEKGIKESDDYYLSVGRKPYNKKISDFHAYFHAQNMVEGGDKDDFFSEMKKDMRVKNGDEMKSEFRNKLTSAYKKLLEREIAKAKSDARKKLDFGNAADAEIKKSELTIHEDVISQAEEEEEIAVEDVEETDKLFKDGE